MIPLAIHVQQIMARRYNGATANTGAKRRFKNNRLTGDEKAWIVEEYQKALEGGIAAPSKEASVITGFSESAVSRVLVKAGIRPVQLRRKNAKDT